MRVRLYAEAIEQAHHYMLPILNETIPDIEIEIIYTPSRLNSRHQNKLLRALYQATTPDGLITLIENNIETPLAVIEFSEAVMTEDHEYQRTPGLFLCAALDIVYIKIAGHKETTRGMGGNTNFNPLSIASTFSERSNYSGYFLCNWKTLPNDNTKLWRDEKFPSIPHENACPLFINIIEAICATSIYDGKRPGNGFCDSVWSNLENTNAGIAYYSAIQKSSNIVELNDAWANASENLGYRRWHGENGTMSIWIYRWGHGMDPDRGCLHFVGTFSDETHVAARYTGQRRVREGRIDSNDVSDVFSLRKRFLEVSKKDKGLDKKMLEQIHNQEIIDDSIDITNWLCEPGVYESLNKPATTLVTFADELLIHDVDKHLFSLRVVWNRKKILGIEPNQSLSHIKKIVERFDGSEPLEIIPAGKTEDPVTYTFVHDVAPSMEWIIHSASYPGAQGGIAILPEGYGRQRKRIYCDSIASKSNNGILFEAKESESGTVSKTGPSNQNDLEKLNDLVNGQMKGVTIAFEGVGVQLIGKPATVVGFYSDYHQFKKESFESIDYVLTIDKLTHTWELFEIKSERVITKGDCSAPPMFSVK
jgi:hypothetical protein